MKYFNLILLFVASLVVTESSCAVGIQPVELDREIYYAHVELALGIIKRAFVDIQVNPAIMVINLITTSVTDQTFAVTETIFDYITTKLHCHTRLESIDGVVILDHGRIRGICLFVLSSMKDFHECSKKFTNTIFQASGKFVFIFIDATPGDIADIFKICWKLGLNNVLVIYQKSDEIINVDSFVPFNQQKCRDTTPQTIVSINKNHKFDTNKIDFFPHKTSDLHKCPIRIGTGEFAAPALVVDKDKDGNITVSGQDVNLMAIIGEAFNFTPVYSHVLTTSQGMLLDNGTTTGIFKLLADGDVDVILGGLWIRKSRLKFFHPSLPYTRDDVIFVVPRGKELGNFEKMILPLDQSTWTVIAILYLIGYFVILIVSCQNEKVRDFVFGRNVRTPFLNIYAVYMACPMTRLPGRNFARFILMNYMLYCLVIRTSYFGAYYNFMMNVKFHKEIETIQQLIESDNDIHTYEIYSDMMAEYPELVNKVTHYFKNSEEMEQSFYQAGTGTKNVAILASRSEVAYENYKNFFNKDLKGKKPYYHVCKEGLVTAHTVFYTSKSFFLINKMDPIIDSVKNAGLIEHWSDETYNPNLDILKALKTVNEPKPLTMSQVKGPFLLYILYCTISCILFVLEVIYKNLYETIQQRLIVKP